MSRSSTPSSLLRVLERLGLLAGKIGRRVAKSLLMCVPMCEAIALGLLMNTKGPVAPEEGAGGAMGVQQGLGGAMGADGG
jgi:hypothetical protein